MNNRVATKTVTEALTVVADAKLSWNLGAKHLDEGTTYEPSKEIVALAKKFSSYKSQDLAKIATYLKLYLDDPKADTGYFWLSKALDRVLVL